MGAKTSTAGAKLQPQKFRPRAGRRATGAKLQPQKFGPRAGRSREQPEKRAGRNYHHGSSPGRAR
eukprot:13083212-Alexandrium_andersonii.AAC.1